MLAHVLCKVSSFVEISQVSLDDRFAAIDYVGGGAMSCSALAGGGVVSPRPMRGDGKDYGRGSGESQAIRAIRDLPNSTVDNY